MSEYPDNNFYLTLGNTTSQNYLAVLAHRMLLKNKYQAEKALKYFKEKKEKRNER